MKNEFDNKLTDKGWQSMLHLLDREMPEQRRRRRFAWWLFALFLLPLAGAGGWWVLRDSEPVDSAPELETPKVSEPIAESSKNFPKVDNSAFSASGIEANGQDPTNREVALTDNTKHGGEDLTTFSRKRSGTNLNNHPATPPHSVFSPSGGEASGQDTANREVALGENTKHGGEMMFSVNTERSGENLTTFKKLSNLNSLSVVPQFVENEIKNAPKLSTVEPSIAATTKKHTEPKRWHFGLSSGLASENLSALNGFTAGAAIDWQFARKWGLRSGLHYGAYRLSAEERPVVSLDAFDYEEATGNSVDNLNTGNPSTPNASDPGSVLVPIERLRQLEIPLLAYWQPLRPLRIFGGFSLGYSLSTQASEQNYASGQLYYANTQDAKSNLNDLAVNNLPRWRTALQTGIGLRFGKHFELDAFYRHGMSGLNKADDTQDNFNPASPNYLSAQSGDFKNRYFLLQGIWFF